MQRQVPVRRVPQPDLRAGDLDSDHFRVGECLRTKTPRLLFFTIFSRAQHGLALYPHYISTQVPVHRRTLSSRVTSVTTPLPGSSVELSIGRSWLQRTFGSEPVNAAGELGPDLVARSL